MRIYQDLNRARNVIRQLLTKKAVTGRVYCTFRQKAAITRRLVDRMMLAETTASCNTVKSAIMASRSELWAMSPKETVP